MSGYLPLLSHLIMRQLGAWADYLFPQIMSCLMQVESETVTSQITQCLKTSTVSVLHQNTPVNFTLNHYSQLVTGLAEEMEHNCGMLQTILMFPEEQFMSGEIID